MNVKSIFQGPNGLRAVWRLLIAFVVFSVCQTAIQIVLGHFAPSVMAREMALNKGVLSPDGLLASEIANLFSLAIALAVMTRIERRTLADYGLVNPGSFVKQFAEGVAWGLAMVAAMLLLQRAEGVFTFGTLALSSREALKTGLLWGVTILCVGFFEEIAFRGYIQSTLASGMGFWPAAAVSSLTFGAVHIAGDSFYNWQGFLSATLFGLLFCLTLWRTGSLWMAIGIHFATDFEETFLFSPPTAKLQTAGHLLSSTLHGPMWLTGGSVGPEASVNGLIVFIVVFLLFSKLRFFPGAGIGATKESTN
jgi:membrane protease YdiL (CAAX protease family)